jgi:Rrf2 family protein
MTYPTEFSKAVMTVLFVADKVRQGYHEFVPTQRIAEALDIPRPTVTKLLRGLSSAGIIETREGVKGGVRLGRPATEVSILDVLDATSSGRPLFQTDFTIRATGERPTRVQAAVTEVLTEAETAMRQRLATTTVEDMLSAPFR